MRGRQTRPASRSYGWRTVAVGGLGLEAVALAGAAVAYAVHAFSLPEPAFAMGLAIFCAACAAGLFAVARGMARSARWAVSAGLTWQAIQLLAGINLMGIRPSLGVPVAVLGVVVGVAVVVAAREVWRPPGEDSIASR